MSRNAPEGVFDAVVAPPWRSREETRLLGRWEEAKMEG